MGQASSLFSAGEFGAMRYNPSAEGKMKALYPALSGLRSGDSVVRYLSYMYDPGSPLRGRFPDLKQRISASIELSGAREKDIFDGEDINPAVVDDIISFLKACNSRLWTMIVTNEETFYEYATRTMDPVRKNEGDDDKDILQAANIKTKLLQDMHDIDQRLTGYYRILTGDDDKLADQVRVRRVTAESIAKLARPGVQEA